MMSREAADPAAGLLREIAAGRLRPLYILFGSDPVVADDILAALRKKVLNPGLEPFDLEIVHATDIGGDRLSIHELSQHMRQPPFGSLRRLIIIRDLDLLDKRLGRELCTSMAKIPDSSVVAVTCEYDRAWQTIFREAGISGSVFATGAPSGEVLVQMVRRWAAAGNLRLEPDAITEMIERVGEEPALLKGEIDKLSILFDSGTPVRTEDVRRLVSHSRVYALGEYVESVVKKDTSQALAVLYRLARWGEEPIKVIGWLAHRLLQRVRAVRGREQEHINRALYQLYLINRSILKGHPDPFALLDLFTVCCCCRQPCGLLQPDHRPEFCLNPIRPAARSAR
ncbi:MAG: DNA polymerase III subunit delta [candidate division WOR-3 bacterium]